jgi:hypothetical protein
MCAQKKRFAAMLAVTLCALLFLSSCCRVGSQARYELYTASEREWVTVFIIDTRTGMTKVVACGSPEAGGHQFGVPFEQMKPVPAPLAESDE